MPRQLKNLIIDEVSSVDRGAGEGVRVLLMKRHDESEPYWKREFSQEQRDAAADSGAALPDGSFPIKSKDDLRNAIQAIGRAKDRARAMAHIKERARALGASDMLPEDWQKRSDPEDVVIDFNLLRKLNAGDFGKIDAAVTALRESVGSIQKDASITDKDAAIAKSVSQFNDYIAGLVPASQESTMTKEEIAKLLADGIKTGVAEATKPLIEKIAKLETDAVLLKMSDKHKAHYDALKSEDDKKKFAAMSSDERDEACAKLAKANDTDPVVKAVQAENADLKKRLAALEGDREAATFEKRATDLGLPASYGDVMRKAYGGDAEAQKKLDAAIKGLNEQIKTGKVFAEFGGHSQSTAGQTAHDQLMAKAHELRNTVNKAAEKPITIHQAYDRVYNDPANAELREQHKSEEARKRLQAA